MKQRLSIYLLMLALMALIVWIWFSHQMEYKPQPQQQNPAQFTNAPIALKTNAVPAQRAITAPLANQNPPDNDREKTNAIRQYMESLNKPIVFFGQIIDQNSNPVPNVKIKATVRHIKIIIPTAWGDKDQIITVERETDHSGRFEIHGVTGVKGFNIESIQKPGYVLSPRTPHFETSGGSLEQPIIFKMWKESGIKGSLITGSHVFGLNSGEAYTLDLIQGKKYVGKRNGDLRVSITRPNKVNSKDRYPWSYSIGAIDGGLIETEDEFMYLAPDTGYQPEISRQFEPTDADWNFDIAKQFYIRSRNGQVYGRIQVVFYSVYNMHSAIEINYALNPNGSKNLQP